MKELMYVADNVPEISTRSSVPARCVTVKVNGMTCAIATTWSSHWIVEAGPSQHTYQYCNDQSVINETRLFISKTRLPLTTFICIYVLIDTITDITSVVSAFT